MCFGTGDHGGSVKRGLPRTTELNTDRASRAMSGCLSMKQETIDDQNRLIELIQEEGWRVTALSLDQYDGGPFDRESDEGDVIGAEIELTVYIDYSEDGDDSENPYRVK